jgi:hypothetical protein
MKDNITSIRFLNGITLGYHSGGEDRKAINSGLEGLHFAENTHDNRSLMSLYGNIAICYMSLKLIDSALYYDLKSYQIAKQSNDLNIAYPLMNLADAEDSLHHTAIALQYLQQALGFIKNNDPFRDRNFMNVYASMARINVQNAKIDSALLYAEKGYILAASNNDLELKYETASLLSALKENGNEMESLKYYKIAINARDSIFSTERAKEFQILIAKEQVKEDELIREKNREAERP